MSLLQLVMQRLRETAPYAEAGLAIIGALAIIKRVVDRWRFRRVIKELQKLGRPLPRQEGEQ